LICETAESICRELDRLAERGAGLQDLLSRAVALLHASNPRFHWTGVYELFPDDVLRLGPFIGAPTDHVFIAVGRGVCGTAVAERRNINVPDVSKASNYLACSAATKSELVVLIRSGSVIHGQIDIDSHELDAFDDAAVACVERVAARLAEAYARRAGGPRPGAAARGAGGGLRETSGG
jgi:GAF domain-containing protein